MIEINVEPRWFEAISSGRKTIEGRLNRGKFAGISGGCLLGISCGENRILALVSRTQRYDSFESYLSSEGLERTLPGVPDVQQGIDIYRAFYSRECECEHGVLAIELSLC